MTPGPEAVLEAARNSSLDLDAVPYVAEVDPGGRLVLERQSSLHPHGGVNGAWKMSSIGNTPSSRIIDREGAMGQSHGRVQIRRHSDHYGALSRMKGSFHSLLYLATWKIIIIACCVLVLSWFIFANLFMMVSKDCGLKADTFLRAFYLAVETVETIGYGVPDSYFNDCRSGLAVLIGASLWESLLNAVFIAVIYTRISRPQCRARSIIFSEKAIIAEIDGHVYFMFQVVDVRKHQLIESHIRLYCIQHAEDERGVPFQTRAMRLQHPDDDLGGMIMLVLPQLIVHRVDPWSPFWPHRRPRVCPAAGFAFPDVIQRQADIENGNRECKGAACADEKVTLNDVADRFQRGQFEVVCMVEGIEPTTSMTMQARMGYACDDVVFNAGFQRSVYRAEDGVCTFNFDAFQELVELNPEQSMVVQGIA